MLDSFYIFVNDLMAASLLPALAGCFLWGLVSTLLSPCHLASVPVLLGYAAAQQDGVSSRRGTIYGVLFSLGLFASLTLIGLLCTLAGRMLGQVPWWAEAAAGFAMLWLAWSLARARTCCALPGSLLLKLDLRGGWGALVLGALYGVVSGVCTYGFLAPVLAVIITQKQLAAGLLMGLCFAAGHCLPIALAGGALGLVETGFYTRWAPKLHILACLVIAAAGLYFAAAGLRGAAG